MSVENGKIKLKLENISKSYQVKKKNFLVVNNISLEVYKNEFLVILGPGLAGKTVLLNMIAGIEELSSGKIFLDGEQIQGTQKSIGMVFQNIGLLPWKTVMGNTEIGLKFSGTPKKARRETAQKFIEMVGLKDFEDAYPHQLSGGMKQRVGIARAYTNNPDILILDEPFGQLDAQTRYSMQDEILRIWEMQKKTIIFVTNNIEEALYLGERIILFSKCPAEVKEVYDIKLQRPRNIMDPDFLDLRKQISSNMDIDLGV